MTRRMNPATRPHKVFDDLMTELYSLPTGGGPWQGKKLALAIRAALEQLDKETD